MDENEQKKTGKAILKKLIITIAKQGREPWSSGYG